MKGEIQPEVPTLLRVHVFSGLYEVIDAVTPGGHSWSVRKSLQRIVSEGSGAVIVLNYQQEISGLAENVQQRQQESNEDGGNNDLRIVGIGSQIAADIGFGKLKVLGPADETAWLVGIWTADYRIYSSSSLRVCHECPYRRFVRRP